MEGGREATKRRVWTSEFEWVGLGREEPEGCRNSGRDRGMKTRRGAGAGGVVEDGGSGEGTLAGKGGGPSVIGKAAVDQEWDSRANGRCGVRDSK
jgi:hypothetical protein